MKAQKYRNEDLDDVFRQALQPYRTVKPSPFAWKHTLKRVEALPRTRWQQFVSWLSRPIMFHVPTSHQPLYLASNQYRPSPFLSVMVTQMLDVKVAS